MQSPRRWCQLNSAYFDHPLHQSRQGNSTQIRNYLGMVMICFLSSNENSSASILKLRSNQVVIEVQLDGLNRRKKFKNITNMTNWASMLESACASKIRCSLELTTLISYWLLLKYMLASCPKVRLKMIRKGLTCESKALKLGHTFPVNPVGILDS